MKVNLLYKIDKNKTINIISDIKTKKLAIELCNDMKRFIHIDLAYISVFNGYKQVINERLI